MSGCLGYLLLAVAALMAEIASIFLVSSYVGGTWTVVALLAAVGLGVAVLAGRGVLTLTQAAQASLDGKPVGPVMLDGALVAFGGLLLVLPGFTSDLFGLLLLVPPVRAQARNRVIEWGKRRFERVHPGEIYIDASAEEVPPPLDPTLPP